MVDRRGGEQGARDATGGGADAPDEWLRAAAAVFGEPLPGPVFDLACGTGRNALWLAARGLSVVGVDASADAVDRARARGRQLGIQARFEEAWVDAGSRYLRPGAAWGAILVFHFLDRAILPLLASALAPAGVLVYKTHLRHPLRPPGARPRRREYLLEPAELLRAARGLRCLRYVEWADDRGAFAGLLARRVPGYSW